MGNSAFTSSSSNLKPGSHYTNKNGHSCTVIGIYDKSGTHIRNGSMCSIPDNDDKTPTFNKIEHRSDNSKCKNTHYEVSSFKSVSNINFNSNYNSTIININLNNNDNPTVKNTEETIKSNMKTISKNTKEKYNKMYKWDKLSALRKLASNSTITINLPVVSISKNIEPHDPKVDAFRNCENCKRHYNYHDDHVCPE